MRLDLEQFELPPDLPAPLSPLEWRGVVVVDSPVGRLNDDYIGSIFNFVSSCRVDGLSAAAIRDLWMKGLQRSAENWPASELSLETWFASNERMVVEILGYLPSLPPPSPQGGLFDSTSFSVGLTPEDFE